jgi:hypothetical protein
MLRAHPYFIARQQAGQTEAKTNRHDNAQEQAQHRIGTPWFLRNHPPRLKFQRQSSRFNVGAPSTDAAHSSPIVEDEPFAGE